MTIQELQELFWDAAAEILGNTIKKPDRFVRWRYPESGAPDWKISEDIVFLYLNEANDEYGQQRDSQYREADGTVYKDTVRTRVWDLQCTAYGRNSYSIVNQLKDGFFLQRIHDMLARKGVFLVPMLHACTGAPDFFAGHWWERWDVTIRFNEAYQTTENIGRIEEVEISAKFNKP